jgi:hypothetical protein
MQQETFYQELQTELNSGERILWSGQPSRSVIFGPQDKVMIPFSLIWGGFAMFWEASVLGMYGSPVNRSHGPASWFMALWGVPFVLLGQYIIWGRFFHALWKKRRLVYAVTDRRVLTVSLAGNRKVNSAFLQQLPAINKTVRSNGIGTLSFGLTSPGRQRNSMAAWDGGLSSAVPLFVDVEDAENVYRIISDARDRALRKD